LKFLPCFAVREGVGGFRANEVLLGQEHIVRHVVGILACLPLAPQSIRLPFIHGSKRVLHGPSVAEPVLSTSVANTLGDDPAIEATKSVVAIHQPIELLVDLQLKYPEKLVVGIIGKVHLNGESAGQPGIVCEKALHLLVVSSEDEHNLATEILDFGEKVVEHSSTARVVAGSELVGFVKEENAASVVQNLIDHLFAPRNADICETRPSGFLEAHSRNHANFGEKLGVNPRDRGFP
jgi:hypothetical protein